MNSWKFILRNLVYYRRTHLWVVLGTMVSTAIFVGALVVGDSVRHSLQQMVFDRLGKTEFALTTGDRLFRIELADELTKILETPVAPLLRAKGIAVAEGGQRRLNNTQVIGIDGRFGTMGNVKDFFRGISSDEAIINHHLSSRLGLEENDEFLLRIEKLDFMPRDAPLALDTESFIAQRFRVKRVATDSEFGRFNLRANQVAPYTVFVSLTSLARAMDWEGRANVLLVAEKPDNPLDLQRIHAAFKDVWKLPDGGFELLTLAGRNATELRSERLFLDAPVVDAAIESEPNAQSLFTYFVNEIRRGDRSTPYSFVTASGRGLIPTDMHDDEIIINEWLARDLDANVGDQIELRYYVLGSMRNLIEEVSDFRIKEVVPLRGKYLDRDLLPDFPGLTGEESCRDWEPGIPIDLARIREKDEDYWKEYGGTPKAFVTIDAAQKMWQNRFGSLTALRFPGLDRDVIENKLRRAIDPAGFGFFFRPIRKEGLEASTQSVDFSQLFLGLSFFIVISALLLTGLLFVFHVEQRSEENGILLALGFHKSTVKRLILTETTILLVLGGAFGCIVGALYNQMILYALKTIWVDAVGTSALRIHLELSTILMGALMGISMTLITVWLITRKQVKQPISGLQRGATKLERIQKGKPRLSMAISISSFIAVLCILVLTSAGSGTETFGVFFATGSLLLMSGVALANVSLYKTGMKTDTGRLSLIHVGIRNIARRRIRSIALIGLLASGLFIVFTVGANRKSALQGTERRESGTGGFALFGESAIPILYDLNSEKGRRFYGLDDIDGQSVRFVQFRVQEGDDASCLNLNRVSRPQLIGVDPEELARRAAFTFVKTSEEDGRKNPWSLLEQNLSDDVVPAIADQTVIVWGLGKSIGDTLMYMDERGKSFGVKLVGGLANSIFQGNIIISEKTFIQKYPSISGYRLFLIDAPFGNSEGISEDLSWAFQDQGLDVIHASARLAEFNKVQNTYLTIFLILGGFGLILGSVGIGIVVWRNINEQRGEFSLLRAIGYTRKSLYTIILSEHTALLSGGILLGIVASFVATLPVIMTPGSEIPYFTVFFLLIVVFLNGCVWATLATFMAIRGNLLPALRNE